MRVRSVCHRCMITKTFDCLLVTRALHAPVFAGVTGDDDSRTAGVNLVWSQIRLG